MCCPGERARLQVGSREHIHRRTHLNRPVVSTLRVCVCVCVRLINANELAPLQLEACVELCLDAVCCHANVLGDFAR